MDLSAAERQRLCDLFESVGPDAPTLCEGWTTKDLAAHLVLREWLPLASIGAVLPPAAPLTDRVQAGLAARPFAELVAKVRSGPPLWSPFRLPGVGARANFAEYYVHHEDVRRPAEGGPRLDSPELDGPLWATLRSTMWLLARHLKGVELRLVRPDGDELVAKQGSGPVVTLTGTPRELLMYMYGRRDTADVELTGEPTAVAAFRATRLGV
jgi:uncharacterized protein (TIGR03085 family)